MVPQQTREEKRKRGKEGRREAEKREGGKLTAAEESLSGAVYNSCREAHLHQYNGGIMNGTLVHGRMKDEG